MSRDKDIMRDLGINPTLDDMRAEQADAMNDSLLPDPDAPSDAASDLPHVFGLKSSPGSLFRASDAFYSRETERGEIQHVIQIAIEVLNDDLIWIGYTRGPLADLKRAIVVFPADPDPTDQVPCPKCGGSGIDEITTREENEERRAHGYRSECEHPCYRCGNTGKADRQSAREQYERMMAEDLAYRVASARFHADRKTWDQDDAESFGECYAEWGSGVAMSGGRPSEGQYISLLIEDRMQGTMIKLGERFSRMPRRELIRHFRAWKSGSYPSADPRRTK